MQYNKNITSFRKQAWGSNGTAGKTPSEHDCQQLPHKIRIIKHRITMKFTGAINQLNTMNVIMAMGVANAMIAHDTIEAHGEHAVCDIFFDFVHYD